jgi:hypothetical protein
VTHKNLNFYIINFLYVGSVLLNLPTYIQKHFVKARDRVYCIYKFLAISMLVHPDPEPHSHYRLGSRRA